MIAAQFAISIFILSMVLIIHFQNEMLRELSNAFPKADVLVLDKMDSEGVRPKHELLRQELTRLPGVERVSYSNIVPFAPVGRFRKMTPIEGDESQEMEFNMVSVDWEFLAAYDTDIVAGRGFDKAYAEDLYNPDTPRINVVVNQMTAENLGFGRGQAAIGKSFYRILDEDNPQPMQYTIVGVIPDQYFRGVHIGIKPLVYFIRPDLHRFATVRLTGENLNQTLQDIDGIWKQHIQNYPIERKFLDNYFRLFFRIPEAINKILGAFAAIALSLALIGLFGLAAFLAQRRTKEIGIRKVMGASVSQIVRLLIWQFSKPVIWSLLVALPLAYLASSIYLDFYAERFDFLVPVILLAAVVGVATAWVIVAGHAINIAKATPIRSLRYE